MALVVKSNGHMECGICRKLDWCNHLQEHYTKVADAKDIHPPCQVVVPIFPITGSVFVTVRLDDPVFTNGPALMTMTYLPDFGANKFVPLGYWSPGEGRFSMRKVIIDWIKSQQPAKLECPSSAHNFAAQKALLGKNSDDWYWINVWYIIMEKACYPCVVGTDEDAQASDVPDVDNRPEWSKR